METRRKDIGTSQVHVHGKPTSSWMRFFHALPGSSHLMVLLVRVVLTVRGGMVHAKIEGFVGVILFFRSELSDVPSLEPKEEAQSKDNGNST